MDIDKKDLKDGSCNFCKGTHSDRRIEYPYDSVYVISRTDGNGLCARICDTCLSELIEFKDYIDNE